MEKLRGRERRRFRLREYSPPSKSEVDEAEEHMSEEDRPKKHRAGRKSVNGFVKVSAAKGKELWRPSVKNH